jgi:hypothetical protein
MEYMPLSATLFQIPKNQTRSRGDLPSGGWVSMNNRNSLGVTLGDDFGFGWYDSMTDQLLFIGRPARHQLRLYHLERLK